MVEIFTHVDRIRKQAEAHEDAMMPCIALETGYDTKKKKTRDAVLHDMFAKKPKLVDTAFRYLVDYTAECVSRQTASGSGENARRRIP